MQTITYYLIIFIGYFTNLLPQKLRVNFGKIVGNILILLSNKRKNITYNNIKNVFPQKSEDEILRILKQSYQNLGITLVELLYLKKIKDSEIEDYFEIENFDIIEEKLKLGKGILFLSGHYGNWELFAFVAGYYIKKKFDKQFNVVVKPQRNKRLNEVLNHYRSKKGNKLISSRNAAPELIKILKNNDLVAIIADQKANKKFDIIIDFLGRKAVTYIAPAKLAIKYNVPIIVGYSERQENNKYKAVLKEIEFQDIINEPKAIELLTIRHSQALEEQIYKNPNQWAWQHNRWN